MKRIFLPALVLITSLILSCTPVSSPEISHYDIGKEYKLYSAFKDYDIDVFPLLYESNDFDTFIPDAKYLLRRVSEGKGFIVQNGTVVKLLELNLHAAKVKIICCENNIGKEGWIDRYYLKNLPGIEMNKDSLK